MQSQVFNGSRFWTYFKYDLTQMWRNHVKAAVGIGFSGLILYTVAVAFHLIFQQSWQAPAFGSRIAVFVIACLALELYQTRTYGYLTDRRQGSAWLMLPASTFEKWLSMILMTLVVIPVIFIAVYAIVDGALHLLDPTYGKMLFGSAISALQEMQNGLIDANSTYETTWSLSVLVGPFLGSHCVNFLFFLLCGITFKRNKILWAFVILFGVSSIASLVSSMLAFSGNLVVIEDFAQAEEGIRAIMNWGTGISFALAALLAGGVYLRLKTLKH